MDSFGKRLSSPQILDWVVGAFIACLVIAGIATLSQYGLTWDEALGDLFFGSRNFSYLTTLDPKFARYGVDLSLDHHPTLNLAGSPYRHIVHEFPSFANVVSAGFMHLLAFELGWMDPVDAFHLPKILMVAVLLWVLYRFMAREFGRFSGLASVLLLATFPRLWGDMHFNPKDVPETVLFALTIFAYFAWQKAPTWPKAAGTGLLFGAALGTKANALFIPFVVVLGLWPNPSSRAGRAELVNGWKRSVLHHGVMAAAAVALYVGTWPYLYVDASPVPTAMKYFKYILSQGSRSGEAHWSWEPSFLVLAVTPYMLIALSAIGLGIAISKLRVRDPRRVHRLLLVWCLLPIVRISLPGMVNFDGIRHFLEYVPAMAMLAGVAAAHVEMPSLKPGFRRVATLALPLLILAGAVESMYGYWGFEYLYYNQIVGGFSGARKRWGDNEVCDYWASTYRKGMFWMNQNAEPGARLYVPVASWIVRLTTPTWLRSDIQFVEQIPDLTKASAKAPIYIMALQRSGFISKGMDRVLANAELVHHVSLDNEILLRVVKYPRR